MGYCSENRNTALPEVTKKNAETLQCSSETKKQLLQELQEDAETLQCSSETKSNCSMGQKEDAETLQWDKESLQWKKEVQEENAEDRRATAVSGADILCREESLKSCWQACIWRQMNSSLQVLKTVTL